MAAHRDYMHTTSQKPNHDLFRRGSDLPVTIDIVVERQLFVLLNRPVGEDAHSDAVANGPLRDVAIWVTTVVGKPANTTALRRVDELSRG